ncbi:MAG: 50S ribosomal protein L4 [Bacteroidia bacterium]
MELAVFNIQGAQTGRSVELSSAVFGLETPNDHAIYLDVRYRQANERQGTHKAKTRAEVSGSTKKLYRQKGTGNARQGNKRAPHHRHGGRVFGPVPHEYGFRLNKKVRQLARRSALTYKARESAITVVENFTFDKPKTKDFLNVLTKLNANDKKVLFVLPAHAQQEVVDGKLQPKPLNTVYLAGRNLPNVNILSATDINTFDILNAGIVVMTESAVSTINERLG